MAGDYLTAHRYKWKKLRRIDTLLKKIGDFRHLEITDQQDKRLARMQAALFLTHREIQEKKHMEEELFNYSKRSTKVKIEQYKSLVEKVLKTSFVLGGGYGKNYMTYCPFCSEFTEHDEIGEEDISLIEHTPDCTYLLAKKLKDE